MSNPAILHAGTITKAEVLRAYANRGPAFGRSLGRRYLYDVAHALVEMEGAERASSALYEIGDAIASRLPLKDWKEFSKPPELATDDTAPSVQKRIVLALNRVSHAVETYKFWIGLFIGLFIGARG